MRSATAILLIAFALIATALASDSNESLNEAPAQGTVQSHFCPYFPIINRPITECPEYQEWTYCASACEPHCNNFRGQKCGPFMTLQCVFQCVCKPGYLRIDEKECVREDSVECNGRYDPMDAFKRHKYSGVQAAHEEPVAL